MNELLQRHGCSNVFSIPVGLKELMSDISREVIREHPSNILEFITNYLSALIITRENGMMAVRVLDNLCDCRPSLSEHLMQLGLGDKAEDLANIISEEIRGFTPVDEKDKIKESKILGRILKKMPLDEETAAQVCAIARNAYRDYWYKKNKLENQKSTPKLPWEVAAQHTLAVYKTTKPTIEDMNCAAEKIQAAYKGYYVRKNMLQKVLRSNTCIETRVVTSDSRSMEFGPIVSIKVQEDNIEALFDEEQNTYDAGKTVCLCLPGDKMNHNTPAEAVMSRHSETIELHAPESAEYGENDLTAATAFGSHSEWKDRFYLEAMKKAIKDREEVKMSAPTVVTDVPVVNFDDGGSREYNALSEKALENEEGDADNN